MNTDFFIQKRFRELVEKMLNNPSEKNQKELDAFIVEHPHKEIYYYKAKLGYQILVTEKLKEHVKYLEKKVFYLEKIIEELKNS